MLIMKKIIRSIGIEFEKELSNDILILRNKKLNLKMGGKFGRFIRK